MSSAVLFLLTAGLVCGRAAAEKKLVYVTVVSDINMWCISKEAVLNCVAFRLGFSMVWRALTELH